MKISNVPRETAQGIEQARATQAKAKTDSAGARKPSSAARANSNVEISDDAHLMNQAMDAAKGTPDVNIDRVAAIKKAILDGSYRISSEDVAEKLLDQHLNIQFGKNQV